MIADNASIWFPGTWKSRLGRLEVVCEKEELTWSGLVAHVEAVLAERSQVFIVVRAVGTNPRDLSDCDIANAELTSLVVSRQRWRTIRRKEIRALLQFPGNCRVEVDVNLGAIADRLRAYRANTRQQGSISPIPTPLLSYLLTR